MPCSKTLQHCPDWEPNQWPTGTWTAVIQSELQLPHFPFTLSILKSALESKFCLLAWETSISWTQSISRNQFSSISSRLESWKYFNYVWEEHQNPVTISDTTLFDLCIFLIGWCSEFHNFIKRKVYIYTAKGCSEQAFPFMKQLKTFPNGISLHYSTESCFGTIKPSRFGCCRCSLWWWWI